jgi:PEP-CTERM motif
MKMRTLAVAAGLVVATGIATPALAGPYIVTVQEASGVGAFDAVTGSAALFAGKADLSTATFTYNGALNFVNNGAQNSSNTGDLTSVFFGANVANISGYVGSGPASVAYGAGGANFNTLAGFLNTSGSIAGYGYGSLYTFTSLAGTYGGQMFTITHDDGVAVYANGVRVPGTTAGPTSAITETVTLPGGTTVYSFVYGRENGSPSVLQVTAVVPEPATWAMMLVGFGLVGGALRRRRTVATRVRYA